MSEKGVASISVSNLKKSFDGGKDFVLNGLNLEVP